MGQRGPKKQPTSLRLLRGDPSREGRRIDPQPTGCPTPPEWLSAEELGYWNRIVPSLVAMGTASAVDADELAAMCRVWIRWLDESSRLSNAKPGTKSHKNLRISVKELASEFLKYHDRFGMNPSSRAGLKVGPQENQNELDKFLAEC